MRKKKKEQNPNYQAPKSSLYPHEWWLEKEFKKKKNEQIDKTNNKIQTDLVSPLVIFHHKWVDAPQIRAL